MGGGGWRGLRLFAYEEGYFLLIQTINSLNVDVNKQWFLKQGVGKLGVRPLRYVWSSLVCTPFLSLSLVYL